MLDILPDQDKIRMQHYCPLHPQVAEAIAPLLDERCDEEPMFKQLSFERWLKQQRVPLLLGSHHFVPGDLRKFCEQMSDIPAVGSVKQELNADARRIWSRLEVLQESKAWPGF